jgi:hypothetical protein
MTNLEICGAAFREGAVRLSERALGSTPSGTDHIEIEGGRAGPTVRQMNWEPRSTCPGLPSSLGPVGSESRRET